MELYLWPTFDWGPGFPPEGVEGCVHPTAMMYMQFCVRLSPSLFFLEQESVWYSSERHCNPITLNVLITHYLVQKYACLYQVFQSIFTQTCKLSLVCSSNFHRTIFLHYMETMESVAFKTIQQEWQIQQAGDRGLSAVWSRDKHTVQ